MMILLHKNELLLALAYFIFGFMIKTINTLGQGNLMTEEGTQGTQRKPFNTVVSVYKCPKSKLPFGYEVHVKSFAFNDEDVTLKVKNSRFEGCGRYGTEYETTELWRGDWEDVEDEDNPRVAIENYLTSISPQGVLNVKDHFYSLDEYCIDTIEEVNNVQDLLPKITFQYCPVNCSQPVNNAAEIKRPCIRKCCPVEKSVGIEVNGSMVEKITGCDPTDLSEGGSIWKGFFYDKDNWGKRIVDLDMQSHRVKPHFYRTILTCHTKNLTQFFWYTRTFNGSSENMQLTKLLTDGRVLYISPQRRWEPFEDESQFCIDGIQGIEDEGYIYTGSEKNQVLSICEDLNDTEEEQKSVSGLYMWTLFIASVFYIGTALVYALLWDKQNTHGWTIFSLVTSLFFMCVFLGNAHRLGLDGNVEIRGSGLCIANAILAHFFMLASFTWLSIISFDFYCTFRSMRPHNPNDKKLKTFFYYCIIGMGLPAIVVIVGLILEHKYPERESLVVIPEYGDSICFLARWSQGVYVYYIMAFLLSINMILTVMTFYKLYTFQKGTSAVRSSSSGGDRKMMSVYLKLSVVLGTSWVFEFISWLSTEGNRQHWIWTVFDMYNLLTAILLFYIFACKESNMVQMEEKYQCLTPLMDVFRRCGLLTPSNKSQQQSSSAGTGLTSTGGDHKMQTVGNNGIENKGFQSNS